MIKKLTPLFLLILLIGAYLLLTRSRALGALLSPTDRYQVINEEGDLINARVYSNRITTASKSTDDLIIYFENNPTNKFLTVSLSNELVGYNDHGFGYNMVLGYLFMPRRSLSFTPQNAGYESRPSDFSFSNGDIKMKAVDDFVQYGTDIFIEKKTQ